MSSKLVTDFLFVDYHWELLLSSQLNREFSFNPILCAESTFCPFCPRLLYKKHDLSGDLELMYCTIGW